MTVESNTPENPETDKKAFSAKLRNDEVVIPCVARVTKGNGENDTD